MSKAKPKTKPNSNPKSKKIPARSNGKHPGGRPTEYNQDMAARICEAVAITTDGLKKITDRIPDFPAVDTIRLWRHRFPEFSAQYADAKRFQAELLAEEIIDIADDVTYDTLLKTDKEGNDYEACNSEWINRSRLRVDSRKWVASKLLPKIYGEKTTTEATVTIRHEDLLKELE